MAYRKRSFSRGRRRSFSRGRRRSFSRGRRRRTFKPRNTFAQRIGTRL